MKKLNATPHFSKNATLLSPEILPHITVTKWAIPPCRVGFFCARAKGVRGMSAPKIATSHNQKSYNVMYPANLSSDKHLWGAWGVAATSRNSITTK